MKRVTTLPCFRCGKPVRVKATDAGLPYCALCKELKDIEVTTEVRGNRVIENRGRVCCGSSCGIYRQDRNSQVTRVYQ